MPQHSFGASARAWATISSSIERAIRIRRTPAQVRSDAFSEVISSSSSSLEWPLIASLNSRIPLPIDLPTSGRRFGPRMTRAMTSTITSSSGPTLNGISLPRPFEWVPVQGTGSAAGLVGMCERSLGERITQHDKVLRATGHHGRDAAERVERQQPPPHQLVRRDRGALELGERTQRVAAP